MEKVVPIETIVGFISYRDTIFLDKVESDGYNWAFIGEFNGSHVTNNQEKLEWIPFRFTFNAVQNIFTHDVDFHAPSFICHAESDVGCFDRIDNSAFLENLDIREDRVKKENLTHFCLSTYDIVFHLIATGYTLEIDKELFQNGKEKSHRSDS